MKFEEQKIRAGDVVGDIAWEMASKINNKTGDVPEVIAGFFNDTLLYAIRGDTAESITKRYWRDKEASGASANAIDPAEKGRKEAVHDRYLSTVLKLRDLSQAVIDSLDALRREAMK